MGDLDWHTLEGFVLPAVLQSTDSQNLPHLQALALLRRQQAWSTRDIINRAKPEDARQQAAWAVKQSAQELEIRFDQRGEFGIDPDDPNPDLQDVWAGESGVSISHQGDLARVLHQIDLRKVPITLEAGRASLTGLAYLLGIAEQRGIDGKELRGGVNFDPILLALLPEPILPSEQIWLEAQTLVTACQQHCPGIRPLLIECQVHPSSAVLELAGSISAAIACIRQLQSMGLDIQGIQAAMALRVDVSQNLLMAVAQLRALRLLMAKVAHAFGMDPAKPIPIHAYTSLSYFHRSRIFDLQTNWLRNSVQALAAVLGGCDSLTVEPADANPDNIDSLGLNLARNQQHLLRHESMLHRVSDPLAGSYAIETMTHHCASQAWALVQQIEGKGGILKSKLLQSMAADTSKKMVEQRQQRKQSMIGINRYVDPQLEGRRKPTAELDAWQEKCHRELQQDCQDWRQSRDPALQAALDQLKEGQNLWQSLRTATALGASIGEVEACLEAGQDEWAEGEEAGSGDEDLHSSDNTAFESADFELLRLAQEHSSWPRTLLVLADDSANSRKNMARMTDVLRAGGQNFQQQDIPCSLDQAKELAGQEKVDVLIYCHDKSELYRCGTDPSIDNQVQAVLGQDMNCIALLQYLAILGTLQQLAQTPGQDLLVQGLEEEAESWRLGLAAKAGTN